jgi:hypothetical protein
MRIRIQFWIQIQGFWWPKLKDFTAEKNPILFIKNYNLFIKNCDLFIPRHLWRTSKLQEKHSALKKECLSHKKYEISSLFLSLWVILPSWISTHPTKVKRIRIHNTYLYAPCLDFGLTAQFLFQRSQLCSSLSRLSVKTSDSLSNPARVAASAVASSHKLPEKIRENPP